MIMLRLFFILLSVGEQTTNSALKIDAISFVSIHTYIILNPNKAFHKMVDK